MRLVWSAALQVCIAVYSVYGWVNGHGLHRAASRTSALLEACAEEAHAQWDDTALIVETSTRTSRTWPAGMGWHSS
eukprot:2171041-Alexandrium_andersonii.AAC.1